MGKTEQLLFSTSGFVVCLSLAKLSLPCKTTVIIMVPMYKGEDLTQNVTL